MGEEETVSLCSELINGGTDTSATAVEWPMFHLVTNQTNKTNGDVVVKKTLRRHPPTHFVLSHAEPEETELGGYAVPRGANVEFYTAANPGEFRPEGFLEAAARGLGR